MEQVDLIMLAAGKGERMNAPVPKQLLTLAGKPVLARTLEVFRELPFIGNIHLTVNEENGQEIGELVAEMGIDNVGYVSGGATRHDSVDNALSHVESERVIIQNAVMPFVTPRLIENLLAVKSACVTPVSPSPYTVFREMGRHKQELPQKQLRYIKSPQVAYTEAARDCYDRARREGYVGTNDVCVFHRYGYDVAFVPDEEMNIKLTTPLDFLMAEAIWKQKRLGDETNEDFSSIFAFEGS